MAVHLYLLMSTNIKLDITALLARKQFDFIICSCNEENNERVLSRIIILARTARYIDNSKQNINFTESFKILSYIFSFHLFSTIFER